VGVSLGGSALLNWIGRAGSDAGRMLAAAATVSVPLDLMAAGLAIDRGFNLVYARYFLRTLKPKALSMAARFPGVLDAAKVRRVRTMWAFDDAVTAPLHGFAGTRDYWTRASAKPWLAQVALPTLVLNARNDPFVPAGSLPAQAEVSPAVTLEQPAHGGHCGFLTGPAPGRLDWMPRRVLQFLARGH
jgi:predicted alpha/beta-fold hydrolase